MITVALSYGILTAFPQHIRAAKQREFLVVEIDQTTPWGFFNGAAQNNLCKGGALLFFSYFHFLNFPWDWEWEVTTMLNY